MDWILAIHKKNDKKWSSRLVNQDHCSEHFLKQICTKSVIEHEILKSDEYDQIFLF